MKRIDQILNDCVFDKKIKKDTATVSVSVAEVAMRRYAEQKIKELERLLQQVVDYDKNNQIGSNGWEYLIGQIEIKMLKK